MKLFFHRRGIGLVLAVAFTGMTAMAAVSVAQPLSSDETFLNDADLQDPFFAEGSAATFFSAQLPLPSIVHGFPGPLETLRILPEEPPHTFAAIRSCLARGPPLVPLACPHH